MRKIRKNTGTELSNMTRNKLLISIMCVMIAAAGVLSSCGRFGKSAPEGSHNTGDSENSVISDAAAMDIVLSRVPGADAEDFTRFEKELDDGHWIYLGELVYQGIEYEFEIEGCNGNILQWSLDN